MNIYVVIGGDSIWSISQKFGVNPENIIRANALDPNESLVIGQTLVVPSTEGSYMVQPGDSLWNIASRFGVSLESIISVNNISDPAQIYPGMMIIIPSQSKNYGYIETNAFIQPGSPERDRNLVSGVARYLTYLTPFSHQVTEDGSLTPLNDDAAVNTGRNFRTAPLLSVTNISGDNFDSNLIQNILNNENLQNNLIDNIVSELQAKSYSGVVIDFERIPPADREKYNDFLRKLVARLHPMGYVVGTALAPKTYDITTGSWHGAHDYRAHGEIADFVIIMTYEWGWSGGPPMAVAPINEVRKVINYAASVIPANKIFMGMPLYGYDWTLPYIPGGEFAEAIGNQEAIDRARRYGAEIKYDEVSQSPYYNYIDEQRREHVVWFEDARSVSEKYKLSSEYGLRGVSYWALGQPFPQNWQVLDNMFFIEKVIPDV
ncbi:glycoside hydrolase family 18 protein [Clostridium tyrobutyricum]|uniref:glycoside hydrolase family 18 protein n=1 Tax=Clostridium tyrobutyricum TaxID=1519 RepID=UPI001C38A77D|nr:glycoside hydrolase family 18 protein [Clostridium tyrobutyricum]MBV4450882.1 glycoside hydrolase family 18 protein [Clostridium tyrobutyricum]MCH4199009.1 glycoside hydrolase family 18 protein [Clostridium tyrobutyricum]MCH4257828.1 glycoside hydrolase family 18 protein [Clostridium tyrobutyricum]MCI1238713.1 glycoside hydrolase family 18 protein [Clostridium tyrobutyricum]MCI1652518.1 glycoside hydrolase family 18 protein [Clostridium tyrobutyricum]